MINFLTLFVFLLPWNKIKNFYTEKVNSIYAEFYEILYSNSDKFEYEGKLWAKKRGFLKFFIEKPDSQLLFVRENKVFLYDFTQKKETEIFSSPYLPDFFLFNFENFYYLKDQREISDTQIFYFERKDTSLVYDEVFLYMPNKGYKPYKISVKSNSLGVEYIINFKKFVLNPLLTEDIFKKQKKEGK